MLVFVDGEIIIILNDLLCRHEEGLVGTGPAFLTGPIAEAADDIRDIVLADRAALVIQGEAVGFHIIEPDLVSAAVIGFGEDQNGSADAGIGLKHTGGHGDNGFQPVPFDDFLADGLVRGGGTEENTVRDDAGTAPADFQHLQEQGQEEKLRFLCFAYFLEPETVKNIE